MENSTNKSTPTNESETSPPISKNNTQLYEVTVLWRIVKIKNRRMIRRGNLGAWKKEEILAVAESKERAEQLAKMHYIQKGFEISLGFTPLTHTKEVEIDKIKRIA